jgi:hypothetical protein
MAKLNVPRSELYSLFEDHGGVARFIWRRRLDWPTRRCWTTMTHAGSAPSPLHAASRAKLISPARSGARSARPPAPPEANGVDLATGSSLRPWQHRRAPRDMGRRRAAVPALTPPGEGRTHAAASKPVIVSAQPRSTSAASRTSPGRWRHGPRKAWAPPPPGCRSHCGCRRPHRSGSGPTRFARRRRPRRC